MNMDSSAAFAMPNISSSRWRKDHTTQNKFGDSNMVQANFALITGPKEQEAAELECFPYGATMPKCKKTNVGIESNVTILAMSSKRLISEDINGTILAGWGLGWGSFRRYCFAGLSTERLKATKATSLRIRTIRTLVGGTATRPNTRRLTPRHHSLICDCSYLAISHRSRPRPFGSSQSNHDLLVSNPLSLRGTMLLRRRSFVSGTGKTYFLPSHPANVTGGGVTSLRYFNNRHPTNEICRGIQQQRRFRCVSRKANISLH